MKILKTPLLALCLSVAAIFNVTATNLEKKQELILQNPQFEVYHGWLKYLDWRIGDAVSRLGLEHEETVSWIRQRDDWVERILEDPRVFNEIRGTQEWAYFSKADESGQPFRFATPVDYDASKSYGLIVYMHGYSGNHIEHMPELPSIEDNFMISVLGRARGGFYEDLSENDVMSVIQFMLNHWNIDPRRIHLSGGSMGGWATFYLSNRYPDLVASARPTCGFAPDLPVANWQYVPFYSTHSKDDPVVPVVLSRVPLKALKSMGGQVVIDETDGLGHAAWDYHEGSARADEWYKDYIAPDSKSVRSIDYTATDGIARGAYWAEIETWGDRHKPARMQLTLGAGNDLYLNLDNVRTLCIDVKKSPIDPNKDLSVLLDGQPPVVARAPLAEKLFFTKLRSGEVEVTHVDPWEYQDAVLKHYPGGARNLYNGDPILVVWGTQGTDEQNAAMLHAADTARRSPHPGWTSDEGQTGPDGVIHEHMTYSRLKGKADVDVTDDDMQQHQLVLIGSSELNAVAAKISVELPVTIHEGKVSCNDGVSWECEDPLVFLTHYNPLQKDRLFSWVSTSNVDFLNSGWKTTSYILDPSGAPDLAVLEADSHVLCGARTMNSDWNWSRDYADSRMMSPSMTSKSGWYDFLAEAYQKATGADASIVSWSEVAHDPVFKAGQTRLADGFPFVFGQRLAVMDLSLGEMKQVADLFENIETRRGEVRLIGDTASWQSEKDDSRRFKVVMDLNASWSLAATGRFEPEALHYVDIDILDALKSGISR